MKICIFLSCFLLLIMTVTIFCSPLTSKDELDGLIRMRRGFWDFNIFSKTTTSAPETSTAEPKPPNDITIGVCEEDDKVKYYSSFVTMVK